MKNLHSNSLRFIPAALGLAFALVAYNAMANTSLYFDSNGTTTGYGSGGSWDGNNWATASGGTKTTGAWVPGDFARFYTAASSTVTVNNDESMGGLYETVSGVTLTINAAGSGDLNITSSGGTQTANTGPGYFQGFLISGSASGVIINAPIVGQGGLEQEVSGALYLYGNNSFSGGFDITGGQTTYFNQNNSFGTGTIYVNGTGQGVVNNSAGAVTIPNNFVMGTANQSINLAGGNAGTTFTGSFTLPSSGSYVINTSSTATEIVKISGDISGISGITVSDNGTLVLYGPNDYIGPTTITTGATLWLGAANAIANTSGLIMSGGTLRPGGFAHSMQGSTLQLTASSAIDFRDGASTISFANSSGVAWTAGQVLNLANWDPSQDGLQFGSDNTGLTTSQLAEIEFNGNAASLGTAYLNASGWLVPEPSTAILGLLGGLGVLWSVRRRTA